MLKGIMAIDDECGVSRNGTMPWPKNSNDLKWFKKNTINSIVIMGKLTWLDPQIPTPLKNRINVLVTNKSPSVYPGADKYISGDLVLNIRKLFKEFISLEKWVIGGPNIVDQLFELIDEFYLTRIYGNYNCDTKINIRNIENTMKLHKTIKGNSTCHFEIWKK